MEPSLNYLKRQKPFDRPIKILQFGEGNFLRAFFDWMVQGLNESGLLNAGIQLVQPIEKGLSSAVNEQDGLYTVLLQGIEQGQTVRKHIVVDSVAGCIDPYQDWMQVVEGFRSESLRLIVSNTTEAGIQYRTEPYRAGNCQNSYPAKLTNLLFERFRIFGEKSGKGLIILPCELIENNGGELKNCVLRYADDWNLGQKFRDWIETENLFLNTLVDRIVTGFPKNEYNALCREFGYLDRLLVCGEPFHFFAIEGSESVSERLKQELPLVRAGFNVLVTENLKPYRDRKVRFLNGAHTSSVLAAHLAGLTLVEEVVKDPVFSAYLKEILFEEIAPTVCLPDEEKQDYAESVLERFSNPFIQHRLTSIALNSVSKWSVRVLPSLQDYCSIRGTLPPLLPFSLAALIVFYRNKNGKQAKGHLIEDNEEIVRFFEQIWNQFENDACWETLVGSVLRRTDYWGTDLSSLSGFQDRLVEILKMFEQHGIRETLSLLLETADRTKKNGKT